MKNALIAVAAALAAGASAAGGHAGRRHAHEAFHQARDLTTGTPAEASCSCTTIYTTITGEGVLVPPPAPTTTIKTPAVVPTPEVTTYHEPGTYTIPATTITVKSTTTVCAAASTHLPSGTHTIGGVTTVVKTSTTVVCPVATVTTENGVVTSKIVTTTYVCPTAGTYTIGPETTTVLKETMVLYPTPVEYPPGVYSHDAIVTTITKTNYVAFCPLTSSKAPEPTPAPAPVTPAPAPVKVAEAPKVEAPKVEAPKVEAPKPAILYEEPKAEPSQAPKSAPAPVGKLGVTGEKWAITYTPYTEDAAGLCKDSSTVKSDIALIASKGFKALRVYSTDCGALESIPAAAAEHGLQLILGIFINQSGIGGAQQQVDQILSWGKFQMVDLVVVGNEALFTTPPRASAGDLAGFISSTKAALKAKGYNGPVTTAEPLNIWQANAGALCDAVDVVGLNIHPFFNADVEASGAGTFARGQLEIAAALCPGKDAYNLETGWPSAATHCNGKACAGPAEQAAAIKSIMAEIGGKSVMFSFGDDKWKQPGEFGCEQHWGSIQLY